MRSMISTIDPLEILVNERGRGEVSSTVERDQRHQDCQVVNRQDREPGPWLHRSIAREEPIFVALVWKTHAFASLQIGSGSSSRTTSLESRTRRTGRGELPRVVRTRGSAGMG